MDAEQTKILRESDRLDAFVREKVALGQMTPLERELVHEEGREVLRQAGLLGTNDAIEAVLEYEHIVLYRQITHLEKKKLLQFHPEWREQLDRSLYDRRFPPPPPVPPHLNRAGVALGKYRSILALIHRKHQEGLIERQTVDAMCFYGNEILNEANVDAFALSLHSDKAALAHAYQLVKQRLLDLYPELAAEVRSLDQSRSK